MPPQAGDGCLIYPLPDGPVGSIRLENIRDGIEDYDYLALLTRVAGRSAAAQLFQRLVTDMTHFSRDPSLLRRVREAAAAAMESRLP